MSGKSIKTNERRKGENEVPDEVIELPHQVYDANWRDDIPDEADDETKEETSLYEFYDDEQTYESAKNKNVTVDLKEFRRKRNRKLGSAALELFELKGVA